MRQINRTNSQQNYLSSLTKATVACRPLHSYRAKARRKLALLKRVICKCFPLICLYCKGSLSHVTVSPAQMSIMFFLPSLSLLFLTFLLPPHVLYPVPSLTPVWPISLFRLLSPFSDLCIVSLISFAFPYSPVPLLYWSLSLRISTLRANIAYLTEEEPLTLSLSCWFLLLQPSLPCSENLNLCPGLNIFFSFPSSPYPDAKRINRELVVVVQSTPGSVVPLAMFRFSDLIFSCSQSGGIRPN